jgi:pilus assembly protein Flp/PilA
MTKLAAKLQTLRSDRGATAVEYGLMVALIAAVIIAAVFFLGDTLNTAFDSVGQEIDAATP